MSQPISAKQFEILQYIYDYLKEHQYPPTVREIGYQVNLSSTSTVHGHLERLEKKGFLRRNPAKPRALELTTDGLAVLSIPVDQIPVVGTVTAGQPLLAIQQQSETNFPMPPNLKTETQPLFMLTINGSSMINTGILDGDQVIVRQQSTAQNGEIVIAMNADNEATCKRFFKDQNQFRLQPENDDFEPIYLEQVTILGKVVGLYRQNIN
ncbi:transcriptional repressor LexA [Bombilactobacillus thymidiniphilus]|uniref:LexA repressor n=1 Tax=Bombilactobacillus thymidiniphilus TaxID=2923363 RepID=A0ABY4PCJ4_9LACO|nr:transcriptional repressor LexA [Bombilactobacillus thymidiniphilus]UQS83480.1 transcriptional repressor LexA [Bombilactobacillus thymidiniphilus]